MKDRKKSSSIVLYNWCDVHGCLKLMIHVSFIDRLMCNLKAVMQGTSIQLD